MSRRWRTMVRVRISGASLCGFMLAWSMIGTMMVKGNDSATPVRRDTLPTQDVLVSQEASPAGASELVAILDRALAELDLDRLPDPESARDGVRQQLKEVERLIRLGTPNGDRWAQFMKLAELHEQLRSDQPSFSRILEIESNLRQNYPGLERAEVVELRHRLRHWANALKYGRDREQTERVFQRRIAEARDLLLGGASFETEVQPALTRVATYLYESGQSSDALAQLHEHFAAPNVYLVVSETFANRVAGRRVDEPSPVNECILGTHVVGDAFLRGDLKIDLLPADDAVRANLVLDATMDSINRGFNRGVVLRTTGHSPVHAEATIRIAETGAETEASCLDTDLVTQIHAICHRLRLVRRIAEKKAAQQKPLADAIAEGRLRSRIHRRFTAQVDEQLNEMDTQLKSGPRPELVRLGLERPEFHLSSTSDAAEVSVVAAADYQLAAATSPPPDDEAAQTDSGLVLRLHQSAVDNVLTLLLAGRTIRNTDLDNIALQFGDEVPPEVQQEVDGDPWEITFADMHPVRVAFVDGRIQVTIQITQMIGKERTVNNAIIQADYLPQQEGEHWVLVRQDDLNIELPSVRSPTQATSLRGVLRAKFNEILAERQEIEPIDLQGIFPQAPTVQVAAMRSDGGWMQISLR